MARVWSDFNTLHIKPFRTYSQPTLLVNSHVCCMLFTTLFKIAQQLSQIEELDSVKMSLECWTVLTAFCHFLQAIFELQVLSVFNMPARCAVPVEEAVTVIKRYLSYFITDTLPAWNSPVWKEISQEPEILKYKWSKENLWNHIKVQIKNEDGSVNVELRQRVWTDILSFEFWKQYRLKCAFVFKKGSIQINGGYYAIMQGQCKSKSCKNPVFGYIEKDPGDIGSVTVRFQCRDTRFDQHEDCKRPLQNERRDILRKDVKEKGVLGSRNQVANDLLKPGDTQCPVLFSDNVLYQLKKESTEQQFGIKPEDRRDLIRTIQNMKDDPVYIDSILQIGDGPFFTFYLSSSQLHCYKEYRASISEIHQLPSMLREESQSIYQMLSEIHDTDIIYLWLTRWLRLKVNKPKEIVCDGARALLNATCLTFNSYTLSNYIKLCFKTAQSNTKTNSITTYIRLDTAHFMHTVSTCDCWKSVVHKSVKSFYMYCIGLLVDSKDFKSFERLPILILIVANVDCEDSVVNYDNEEITPLKARQILENLISAEKSNVFIDEIEEKIKDIDFDQNKSNLLNDDKSVEIIEIDKITSWVKELETQSLNVTAVGEKLNCFYLPTLGKPFKDKIKEFPLWSNVYVTKNNNLDAAVKNLSKQRKNEGKYFKNCLDIKLINKGVEKKEKTKMVKNKSMAYNLLLNGNHSGPVNFQDQCWFAYNTCPFDSIVQIIFNRALENHEFHDFLKNSKNKTFLLAAYFASMGLTSKTFEKIYTERFEILYQIYKTSELTQMEVETSEDENSGTEFISRVIDCFDNVNNLWNKIFLNEPSMFEKVSCLSSSCKDSQRNVPVMTVDYNIVLDRGFSNLEKAINFRGLTRDLYCKNCHEKNLIVSRTLNTYIYIELDVQSLNTKESKKYAAFDVLKNHDKNLTKASGNDPLLKLVCELIVAKFIKLG
ncbi:Similar to NOF: 120.7 kDa protein in NOF-FB transposable element (Drosophila melanogaster) [Cotesia congregata]|uniref:Similar to NOF: 120.7 kDa protein in NOF-FB transposable element (Drosophila melanogaster) n=1 Tax=Cotesia congregata TaxID=51543 RepID=A0A8J2GZC7_COTCN|nr:Similar to NOF: 120.7 kDa protein in NOF-FB transposable element (Drosophila melanogaster) [Cotesia congregata]